MITSGRYDNGLEVLLGWFISDLMSSPVVIVDVHLRNIVYDQHRNRLVLIDGIGDKTIVPLRSWSSTINRWSKKKYMQQMRQQIRCLLEHDSPALVQASARARPRADPKCLDAHANVKASP